MLVLEAVCLTEKMDAVILMPNGNICNFSFLLFHCGQKPTFTSHHKKHCLGDFSNWETDNDIGFYTAD